MSGLVVHPSQKDVARRWMERLNRIPLFDRHMRNVLAVLTFLARHFLFVVFAILTGCILWTITYLVLLAIAVATNGGLGSPLAFPAGIFAVVLGCATIGWGIFAPASAAGALFCRFFRLPRIAVIPVVWVVAFVLSLRIPGGGRQKSQKICSNCSTYSFMVV